MKLIPVLLRGAIIVILLCIFSCADDFSKSKVEENDILEFIDKTREKNISVSEKLRIYDSLYLILKKQKDDTLKRKNLLRLAIGYDESNNISKFYSINKEVKNLALQIQDSLGLAMTNYNIGYYYAHKNKVDSAYIYSYKSNKLYSRLGKTQRIGKSYLTMAIMQKRARDYIGAESNTIKAIQYLEKAHDIRYLASSHNNLGTISIELGNYENAIIELGKTFELRKKIKQNYPINAGTLNNIGLVYESQRDFLKAIKYYKKGLAYDSLIYKRPKTYVRLLDNLIYARFLSGEITDYPALFKKPMRIRDSLNDQKGLASSYFHLADYYYKSEMLDSANLYAREALHVSKSILDNKDILRSLLLLSEINKPEEALRYSKEYIRITDSLQKVERKYRDQFARIRFGTEELEEENVKVSQQRTWLLNVVIGMAILGVLGYIVYYQRKLKHQYKTSNLEQRLLRSQLNPHFLFNALNSVSGLIQKKSDQTIPYISKLGELLRSILENSREEFISLEEELDTITTYLELQSNFSKKFRFDIQVDKSLNKEELLIPPMFLQPFVENAIDHGFKGKDNEKITVTVIQKPKDQVLYFSIEDNGIGYSNAMKNKKDKLGYQSLSGTILKERLALYARVFKKKARYVIEDLDSNAGTKVHLYLPYQLDV